MFNDQNDYSEFALQIKGMGITAHRNPASRLLGRMVYMRGAKTLLQQRQEKELQEVSGSESWLPSAILNLKALGIRGAMAFVLVFSVLIVSSVLVMTNVKAMPNREIYQFRAFIKRLPLQFTEDQQKASEIALGLLDDQKQEVSELVEKKALIPPYIQTQYETDLDAAIEAAEALPEPETVPVLQEIQTKLQEQLDVIEDNHPEPVRPMNETVQQTDSMLKVKLEEVTAKLEVIAPNGAEDKGPVSNPHLAPGETSAPGLENPPGQQNEPPRGPGNNNRDVVPGQQNEPPRGPGNNNRDVIPGQQKKTTEPGQD